jgi:hypothetical protein
MTRVEPDASFRTVRTLAISVKANVRAANVMPELKQAAHEGARGVMTPTGLAHISVANTLGMK